jgi:3-deoxy-manno-octulosonate cytidylyltransferase (CMP-KDO synthetase)
MASTRLPGKPLAPIAGEPMIVHVWRRATEAALGRVVVACGEPEIVQAVAAAGGEAVLVADDVPSGTDRIWLALRTIDPTGTFDTVVNVQGDLPTLDPAALGEVVDPLARLGTDIATLVVPTDDPVERAAPSVVKAVVSFTADDPRLGRALYFTRAPSPWGEGPVWHHIGLYAFTRAAIERFCALPASPLERREKLEQLRALENGMTIGVKLVDTVPFGVDTPEDLERARTILGRGADA